MVVEESSNVLGDVVVRAPGLGDEHQHGVRQPASGEGKQLRHVVQARGVALCLVNQRQEFFEVVAEESALQESLAGAGVVQVAAKSVDFAVVGEQPEGLRQLPGREGVGAVALMD